MCEMKAGHPLVSYPGPVFVVIGIFFSFFSSLLSLSVNDIVLNKLRATLPGLVSLTVALRSELKHRSIRNNMLRGHSKLHCLSVLFSHIAGMCRSAGMLVASLAAPGVFLPAGRCLKYSPDQSGPL